MTEGIFIAGAATGPKDIPASVSQGAAASARVLSYIEELRGKGVASTITLYAIRDLKGIIHRCAVRDDHQDLTRLAPLQHLFAQIDGLLYLEHSELVSEVS